MANKTSTKIKLDSDPNSFRPASELEQKYSLPEGSLVRWLVSKRRVSPVFYVLNTKTEPFVSETVLSVPEYLLEIRSNKRGK